MKVVLHGWFEIGHDIAGANARKAIEAVTGTYKEPRDGFDADRRMLDHAAVLTCQWQTPRRTRTVKEPTAEDRAEGTEAGEGKRAPRYHTFERAEAFTPADLPLAQRTRAGRPGPSGTRVPRR